MRSTKFPNVTLEQKIGDDLMFWGSELDHVTGIVDVETITVPAPESKRSVIPSDHTLWRESYFVLRNL